MGAWYWLGVAVGLGAAVGVLVAGAAAPSGFRQLVGVLLGASLVALAIGYALDDWGGPAAAGGALLGSIGGSEVVRGTLARGGTRAGTAIIVAAAAALLGAIAFVPVVGYVEAVAIPALGRRLRRRAGERHAGLRILARD